MTTARREQIDLSLTPYYHCMARCVRRAFLCGKDVVSGKDFSHRKGWIRKRVQWLASIFAVDVCAYAVMSNHLHVVLHADKDRALGWSEEEVVERHTRMYPMSKDKLAGRLPKRERAALLALWRSRLHDISWFMRGLNEYIARLANKEDKVRGRFWEGRFKSQALVDERGLLACMVYVDLNPVRAGLADSVDASDFTSIQERLVDLAKKRNQRRKQSAPAGMASFLGQAAETGRAQGILPICFEDYVKLVAWTGGVLSGEIVRVPDTTPAYATRDGASGQGWIDMQSSQALPYASAIGCPDAVQAFAIKRGKRSVRGIGLARRLVA